MVVVVVVASVVVVGVSVVVVVLVGASVVDVVVVVEEVMITVNSPDAVFPWPSVAVHFTVVSPTGNSEAEGVLQVKVVIRSLTPCAEATNSTTAPVGVSAALVMVEGTFTTGTALLYSSAPMSHASPAMPGRGAPR